MPGQERPRPRQSQYAPHISTYTYDRWFAPSQQSLAVLPDVHSSSVAGKCPAWQPLSSRDEYRIPEDRDRTIGSR